MLPWQLHLFVSCSTIGMFTGTAFHNVLFFPELSFNLGASLSSSPLHSTVSLPRHPGGLDDDQNLLATPHLLQLTSETILSPYCQTSLEPGFYPTVSDSTLSTAASVTL